MNNVHTCDRIRHAITSLATAAEPVVFHAVATPSENGQHSHSTHSNDVKVAAPIHFTTITSADLDSIIYETQYLIDEILVDQQPCLIAGPHKALKTNLLVALAIALASGMRFLGVFKVREIVRVGVMSGESGLATLQETARRICREIGVRLAELDNLIWSSDLPIFGHAAHMEALREFIQANELRVLAVDPAYLCTPLAADKGNNLFAIGELLRSVNDVCQRCGCTLIICHHMKKTNLGYDPPELADAAWSGWAEWARQWLLINRREPFNPDSDGQHHLWLAAGGSAGHAGLWGLDVTEGRRSDPSGRRWEVSIRAASEVRTEEKDGRKAERKRQELAAFEADLDAVAQALDAHPNGATKNRLREDCGMSGTRFGRAIAELQRRQIAKSCDVYVSNHKNPTEGYRRAPDTAE